VVGDTAERYVPSVPSAAELHLLAEYGYLGECLQWFAVTYGPDAVLNWLEDIVDVVKQGGAAERNPDLRAMRVQGEQAKALIERLHANAAA
jgi:hypothetical protein